MRRIVLAFAFLLLASCQSWAQPQAFYCNKFFQIGAGATSITQIVAGIANQEIYICGYEFNAGAAAATIQLTFGTGVNCNANTVQATPVYSLPINGILVSRSSNIGQQGAPGSALCYTITGTGPLNAVVYYGQY